MLGIRNSEWNVLFQNLRNSGLTIFNAHKIIDEKKERLEKFRLKLKQIKQKDLEKLKKELNKFKSQEKIDKEILKFESSKEIEMQEKFRDEYYKICEENDK